MGVGTSTSSGFCQVPGCDDDEKQSGRRVTAPAPKEAQPALRRGMTATEYLDTRAAFLKKQADMSSSQPYPPANYEPDTVSQSGVLNSQLPASTSARIQG
eukprot:CAMPEP_0202810014 /NCGR_PEP_ID=MMETSP1389-20130828/2215_1 /ASSEMBLY_ACC=CAM_ASM_000865 /TAXON_ID=302021 /ORGANISM="Rhodomonas sp., Strain CCMP768" /LENGTH=99 /DNA_ID=CAMNT_0049480785 /DNA_START=82 /DNA_END=381 /DNA_ORIENTATION=+